MPPKLNNSDSTLAPGYGLAQITLIFWTVKHILPLTSTMISPFLPGQMAETGMRPIQGYKDMFFSR